MKIAISQSNYIPWKGYFDLIAIADVFVIYDEVQYTKNDWRNRNIIKTPNGMQWMTIPVRQETLDQKICDVKVFTHNWHKKHIGSLQANYGKSKFFKEYKDQVFEMYENNSDYISEINCSFIKGVCKMLNIDTKIIYSKELNLQGDKNERLVDACKKLGANTYISGEAAKTYLNKELFDVENIGVEWMDYSGYEEYPQLHNGFEHAVSILDLVFNMGPESRKYLKYVTK